MFASASTSAQYIQNIGFAFDGVVFVALFVYGVVAMQRRPSAMSTWFTILFGLLAIVIIGGRIAHAQGDGSITGRVALALLTLVPLALFRFTRAFARGPRAFDLVNVIVASAIVIGALSIHVPTDVSTWSVGPYLLVGAFLLNWLVVSFTAASYFFAEARRNVGVAAKRMRLFAWATIALTIALLVSGTTGFSENPAVSLVVQLSGATASVLFWFALAPPQLLRAAWRASETDQFNVAVRSLLSGEDLHTVRAGLLEAAIRMTGARGAVLRDGELHPLAWRGIDEPEAHVLAHVDDEPRGDQGLTAIATGSIVVAVGPATPFFGAEERRLLDTLGAFGQLAEERAQLLTLERTANERLREVDQLKTEFVAMVAHDLRSPMSVISGFADTIRDRWDDLTDERKLQFLDLISRNTHSLAVFVEDVLQVARLESGEFHYDLVPFEPRAVVDRIVSEFGLAHPELQLEVDAPTELPPAVGDAERNWQILTNLLTNAMKFSPSAAQVRVVLRFLRDEDAVSIAVCDQGVGISEEDQPRLFQRFSRVGERRATPGTGLGLYIVKSMVEAQGGRIWVNSSPGEGSTFTYTLPAARARADSEPESAR
jgi:signal transduction histidine kinase